MAGKELINKIRKKGICGTIKMIAVKWKKTERDLWNPPISRVRKDLIDRILRRGYSRIVIYENHFTVSSNFLTPFAIMHFVLVDLGIELPISFLILFYHSYVH